MKLLVSLLAVLICATALCFLFARELLSFATLPFSWSGIEIRPWSPIRPFPSAMLVAFYSAVTFTFPVLLYLLGGYLLRAHPRAKSRSIRPVLLIGWPVYLAGAWLGHGLLAPMLLNYVENLARENGFHAYYELGAYLRSIASLDISSGLLCALPVLAILLSRKHIITYRSLSRTRFYAMTAILILVTFAAPVPNLSTLALLVAPFWVVYELCIWIVWFLERHQTGVDYSQAKNGTA